MASLGKDGWGKGKARKARRGAEAPLLIGKCFVFLIERFVVVFSALIAVDDSKWNQGQTYFFGR